MSHPPPAQQPHLYPPANGGRGRGRGYHPNHPYNPGGGRGGGLPAQPVGAWQPTPAMFPPGAGGGPPMPPPPSSNSNNNSRPSHLQPAAPVHPYAQGGGAATVGGGGAMQHPNAGPPRTMPYPPPASSSSNAAAGGGAYSNHLYAAAANNNHPYANYQPPPQPQQPPPMPRAWQPAGGGYVPGVYAPPGGGGTTYYPMMPHSSGVPRAATAAPPAVVPPPARERKPLVITDKSGKPLDFTGIRPAAAATAKSTAVAAITDKKGNPLDLSASAAAKPAEPAAPKTMVITDKDGNPIDLKGIRDSSAATSPVPPTTVANSKETDATVSSSAPPPPLHAATLDKSADQERPEAAVATEPSPPPTSSLSAVRAAEAVVPTPPPEVAPPATATTTSFRVYTKEILLGYKDLPVCMERPADLPEMVIQRTEARSDRGRPGGGGASARRNSSQRNVESGGGEWARGSTAPRRQSSQSDSRPNAAAPPDAWSRGQAPPKPQPPPAGNAKGNRGGRGSYTSNQQQYFDGPVEPLVKSENHWRPRKNVSALVVAEKKVKAILNKMTKEKFDRLSEQMLEIPLLSYETLSMMINNVYEKAIDEPTFGDMYANLCVRLSQIASDNKFVHIIESDEEPPTDDGQITTTDMSSSDDQTPRNKVYRWSHDVSTSDAEIVGPFSSVEECMYAALDEEERTPTARGDMELELVRVSIQRGIFIKIMKKAGLEEGEEEAYYVVYFPISEAEDCGQQISEIFLSEVECKSDASKKNSFKRSLLNKCEEEFLKKDIYDAWQKEKQQYEERKSKLSDQERADEEAELEFRRMKIKKQMLGNVKFIGQLYKVNLLREKVMRFCVGSMLKLEEKTTDTKAKNPEYFDSGNTDIDEEDHEAICNMFATIGSTIDKPPAKEFMNTCFQKIDRLIHDKDLPSRSRFMYKDLIDLRSNMWVPRRKEEKAKTIAEIRKDVEAEERKQAELSAQLHARGKTDPRSSGRGGDYYSQRPSMAGSVSNRPRSIKATARTDDDGFMTVVGGRSAFPAPAIVSPIKPKESMPAVLKSNVPAAPLLSAEELGKRIKSMRTDYMSDGGNVPELLLSWEEMAGTPDAGVELVKASADRLSECRDDERAAIYKMVRELCERGKLTRSDVQNGLAESIEFLDSIVFDCPRIYEYMGILIGDMLQIKMIDMGWFCEQCEKIEPKTDGPASLLRFALLEWKQRSESDVKLVLQKNEQRLTDLVGVDALQAISDLVVS